MNERHVIYLLLAGMLGLILWRMTPGDRAPIDTAADVLGAAPAMPTLPAEAVVGMSYTPDDGEAGPIWYTVPYPGTRPPMPAMASPVRP